MEFNPGNDSLEQNKQDLGKAQHHERQQEALQKGMLHQGGHPVTKKIYTDIHGRKYKNIRTC
jgi:hypothetical protein